MNSAAKLGDLVRLKSRYRRSSNVTSDFASPEALDGYVISPLVRETAIRLLNALLDDKGARSWSLIGPYGSGKSSFCTFIADLLSHNEATSVARRKAEDSNAHRLADLSEALERRKHLLIPVIVTGEPGPMIPAIMRALKVALGSHKQRGPSPREFKRILETDEADVSKGSQLIELIDGACQALARGTTSYSGLLLVIDEAGKFLEWSAKPGADQDVYLMQQLAEYSARAVGGRFALLMTLHQALDSYAARLPRSAQMEWAKVSGRFEVIPFLETPVHLLRLVADAIDTDDEFTRSPWYQHGRAELDHVCEELPNLWEHKACFDHALPLHPISALLLGPLFRLRLAQNERSLFAFLSANEPHGFRSFVQGASASDPANSTYRLPALYDYVIANSPVGSANDDGDRLWSACQYTLHRLDGRVNQLQVDILKATTLLGAASNLLPVRADSTTLALCLGESGTRVDAALEDLIELSAIVYRDFKGAYQVWDGSDLDVPRLVEAARKRVELRGGFAARLQALFPPEPVIAAKHYLETGTFRYFTTRYTDRVAAEVVDVADRSGDGMLFYVIPDDDSSYERARSAVDSGIVVTLSGEPKPLLFVLPTHYRELIVTIVDFLACEDVLDTQIELQSDPIARRAVEERKLRAHDALVMALAGAFDRADGGADARLLSTNIDVPLPRSASQGVVASVLFTAAFHSAPRIKNELVNRATLSSAAAAARRVLLEALVSNPHAEFFGLEGHGPERSIYESVLRATGIHRRDQAGAWALGSPSTESDHARLCPAWERIESILLAQRTARISVLEIYEALARPPFGVREGLSPILVFAYVCAHRERLFIYEDNSYLPILSEDLVPRWLRRPDSIELQLSAEDPVVHSVVNAIYRPAGGQGAIPSTMDAVKALLRVVGTMSSYASSTAQLSEPARRVRSSLKSARDPVQLLLARLPEDVGLVSFLNRLPDEGELAQFAEQLSTALKELSKLDSGLAHRVDEGVCRAFRLDTRSTPYGRLCGRAAQLPDRSSLPLRLRSIRDILSAHSVAVNGADALTRNSLAIAVVGKPLSQWNDQDETLFRYKVSDIAGLFLDAESLRLEQAGRGDNGDALIRVAVLNTTGKELSVVRSATEFTDEVREVLVELRTMMSARGLSVDTLFAALAQELIQETGQ
jgi:hypothetical protein